MKLSEVKSTLEKVDQVNFELPDGSLIPAHFHITEVGKINKQFIDCGGTLREEQLVSFQLWTAEDYDHRLSVEKLKSIIALSEKALNLEDREIEVEYQGETIGKFGLHFNGWNFQLTTKQTDCLAKDNCGIPEGKTKVSLVELGSADNACCTPGGGCC